MAIGMGREVGREKSRKTSSGRMEVVRRSSSMLLAGGGGGRGEGRGGGGEGGGVDFTYIYSSLIMFLAGAKKIRFWPKTMDYSKAEIELALFTPKSIWNGV